MISSGQAEILRQPAAIKAFHRTGVHSQRLGSDHQILASQGRALRRPFEYLLTGEWGHPDRLPQIQQTKERLLESTENTEWPWHEEDTTDLCCPLIIADLLFGE